MPWTLPPCTPGDTHGQDPIRIGDSNGTLLFPEVECTTCSGECQCGPQERVLRRIWAEDYPHGPMTPEQRAWCVTEADSSAEGAFKRSDLEAMSDQDLAHAVIDAWWMYVRSNVEGF